MTAQCVQCLAPLAHPDDACTRCAFNRGAEVRTLTAALTALALTRPVRLDTLSPGRLVRLAKTCPNCRGNATEFPSCGTCGATRLVPDDTVREVWERIGESWRLVVPGEPHRFTSHGGERLVFVTG